jgi:hypothetical protein
MNQPVDIASLVKGLTEAQRKLILESEPGGFGRHDCSIGTPIRGAQYRTAKSLEQLGIGTYTHGSPFGDLYFNTDDLGLVVRAHIEGGE